MPELPTIGQRGKMDFDSQIIPDAWQALGDGTVMNLEFAEYEYLPDQASNNAVRCLMGEVTRFSGTVTGLIDTAANIAFSGSDNWTTPGGMIARPVTFTIASGVTWAFTAWIKSVTMERVNRQLQRWNGEWRWDGISTITKNP